MKVLLTNDDSIYSEALQRLARAFIAKRWEVYVSAPESEQSGVGRACNLMGHVTATVFEGLGCPAWSVSGTPLDCVNLALSHFLKEKPDLVISGINWGVNVSMPMIFSSGTVGGAIEGAAFGIPSIAVSQYLPDQNRQYIQKKIDFLAHEGLMKSIDMAIERTVQYAEKIAKTSENVVHNINFPYPMTSETSEEMTTLVNIMQGKSTELPVYGSLYELHGSQYRFAMCPDLSAPLPRGSDIEALIRGKISHSIIDLKRLCE